MARTINFSVDSRNRDASTFPFPNVYDAILPEKIRNVVSVELVYASYAKLGTENYVNLHIEELVPILITNANGLDGAFAQLPCAVPDVVNEYSAHLYRSIKTFDTPCSMLSRFRIRFLDYAGAPAPVSEHFMRFEITYRA